MGKIVLGAVMIYAAFWTGGASTSYMSAVWGQTTATMVGTMGMSLVLSGVSGMLSSSPIPPGTGPNGSNQSYLFNGGGANPTGQGGKVPILIGRMKIQGIRISGGIDPEFTYTEDEFGPRGDDGHGGHVITKDGI